MDINFSGSATLYLQSEINSFQTKSLSVSNLDTTVSAVVLTLYAWGSPKANHKGAKNRTQNGANHEKKPIFFLGAANPVFPLPLRAFNDSALARLDQEETVIQAWPAELWNEIYPNFLKKIIYISHREFPLEGGLTLEIRAPPKSFKAYSPPPLESLATTECSLWSLELLGPSPRRHLMQLSSENPTRLTWWQREQRTPTLVAFFVPLAWRSSLQSANTESPLTSARFLWADLREGRLLGLCRWRVLRTVEFASEFFLGGFSLKFRVGFTKVISLKISPTNSAANFAGNFRRQISPANFAGKFRQARFPSKFRQANFASETFRRKTPPEHSMVVVLAVKFWVVVPKNLRNTTECLLTWCVGRRAMRPYGKADGAELYLGPGRVTDTKQNCPCCDRLDRTCTLQKDQGPQDRIHLPKNKISH